MTSNERAQLSPIQRLDEITPFASEEEEAERWATHSLGETILKTMQQVDHGDDELPPPHPRTHP